MKNGREINARPCWIFVNLFGATSQPRIEEHEIQIEIQFEIIEVIDEHEKHEFQNMNSLITFIQFEITHFLCIC